jgi:hypothetical protein
VLFALSGQVKVRLFVKRLGKTGKEDQGRDVIYPSLRSRIRYPTSDLSKQEIQCVAKQILPDPK